MADRRTSRILAMQALCQLEVLTDSFLPQLDDFLAEETDRASVREYASGLVADAQRCATEIDALIQEVAEHWDLKRMAMVDRNILRVAACELLHRGDVPPAVVINEAVEISKTFGTADSAGFINGVLDAIAKRRGIEKATEPPTARETTGTPKLTTTLDEMTGVPKVQATPDEAPDSSPEAARTGD